MTTISIAQARALLETYVEAKDHNRPELIHAAFASDASLTFSIATDSITFPPRSDGADAIATTLVSDFATKFDRCRTYYIGNLVVEGEQLAVPWLVLMREISTGALRAGKGFYQWRFRALPDDRFLVDSLHIHIECMDSLPDRESADLAALQAPLPYPWLPAEVLRREINARTASQASLAPLQQLAEPARTR